MPSVTTDRRRGINSSAAIKVPCIAASTANLTLSGEQTVDGIALVAGDRCFAKDQTDATEIGIYQVDTSAWQREPDFDGAYDVVEGTVIPVSRGAANADTYWRITNTGDIVIGTTSLTVAATTVLSSAILNDGSVKMIADFSPNVDVTYSLGTALLQWVKGFFSGDVTAGNFHATADTAAGDKAAMGYTATEGLVLTGQGSTNDVTVKNDADATVLEVATGGVDLEITAGNHIIGTAGKGMDFSINTESAETGATMTSELLDWYEEGTWTPSIGGTATYNAQDGTYTRIGRVVHVSGNIDVLTIGTGSASTISGLPFTVKAGIFGGVSIGQWAFSATSVVDIRLELQAGLKTIVTMGVAAAGASIANITFFQNAARIRFCGTYEV